MYISVLYSLQVLVVVFMSLQVYFLQVLSTLCISSNYQYKQLMYISVLYFLQVLSILCISYHQSMLIWPLQGDKVVGFGYYVENYDVMNFCKV